jgi:ABC-2 type transport system ATP-binding protein
MKIIAGLVQPTGGNIRVLGERIGVTSKGAVSFMPTVSHLPKWMRVKACVGFFADSFPDFDREKAEEIISKMGLKGEEKTGELSTGMLGRLKLALTLSRQAKLYVLDEPLNGLDPVSREKVLEMMVSASREDVSILISSHLINELENILDEVIFLDHGKVVLAGNAENFRQERNKSIDALYREVYGND